MLYFWIPLGAMIYGSIMCWLYHLRKTVVITWIVWLLGFFFIPMFFNQAWPFVVLQYLLAVILLLKWQIETKLG